METVHLELSDQTFIAADRSLVAAIVVDPARWRAWWPDLRLELTRDRGLKGCQWRVTGTGTGLDTSTGTGEIYLEPWQDGTVVHLFLRLDVPGSGRSSGRRSARLIQARTLRWKRIAARLKDELEAGRLPGTAGRPSAQVGPGI